MEQRDTSALKSSLLALTNKGQEIGLDIYSGKVTASVYKYRSSLEVAVPLENMSRKFHAFLNFTNSLYLVCHSPRNRQCIYCSGVMAQCHQRTITRALVLQYFRIQFFSFLQKPADNVYLHVCVAPVLSIRSQSYQRKDLFNLFIYSRCPENNGMNFPFQYFI